MAAMRCPACGLRTDTSKRVCPQCTEFLVPDEPPVEAAAVCEDCGMDLVDGECPVHSLGTPPPAATTRDTVERTATVDFPWGPVDVGASEVWIGRADECGALVARLRQYDNISRRHAVLWCRDGALFVRDQDSMNGTFVNSRRINPNEPYPLHDGDQVRFAADLSAVVRLQGGQS